MSLITEMGTIPCNRSPCSEFVITVDTSFGNLNFAAHFMKRFILAINLFQISIREISGKNKCTKDLEKGNKNL